MKQTKVIGIILGLFLIMIAGQPVRAVRVVQLLPTAVPTIHVITNLNLIPTNTPVPTLHLVKNININILPTATPTLKLIKLPSNLKPVVTLAATATLTPTTAITLSPTVNPTATVTALPTTTTNQQGNNMTFWFLIATVGLLAVIIIVQSWPKKDEEE